MAPPPASNDHAPERALTFIPNLDELLDGRVVYISHHGETHERMIANMRQVELFDRSAVPRAGKRRVAGCRARREPAGSVHEVVVIAMR